MDIFHPIVRTLNTTMLEQKPLVIENSENCADQFIPSKLRVRLLHRDVTFIILSRIIAEILSACEEESKLVVASWNIHSFNLSLQIPWFQVFMQSAKLSYCDGSGLLVAAKYMGCPLSSIYRVAGGTDLVPKLLEHSSELSFFLLGARPDVSAVAVENLKRQYPEIRVAGHHGYFDKFDHYQNGQVIQRINQMKPDVLIVGIGMPAQEDWIRRNKHRLAVKVIIPCGAVIDRIAGRVSDCPKWIAEIGCEWIFRLCREPKRLSSRYLIGNLAFALQLMLAKYTTREPVVVSKL